jgi:hypothetical protein
VALTWKGPDNLVQGLDAVDLGAKHDAVDLGAMLNATHLGVKPPVISRFLSFFLPPLFLSLVTDFHRRRAPVPAPPAARHSRALGRSLPSARL